MAKKELPASLLVEEILKRTPGDRLKVQGGPEGRIDSVTDLVVEWLRIQDPNYLTNFGEADETEEKFRLRVREAVARAIQKSGPDS